MGSHVRPMILRAMMAALLCVAVNVGAQVSDIDAAADEAAISEAARAQQQVVKENEGYSDDDEFSFQEVSAAQQIAEMERTLRSRAKRQARTRIEDLITYDLIGVEGDTAEAVLKSAGVQALTSTASRAYFGDHILIGRDLLVPYLTNYGDEFIVSRVPSHRRLTNDGKVQMDVRVAVDAESLRLDLEEKHFIGKPKVRPIIAVVLEETVDGAKTEDGRGRKILEEALRAMELRVESERMGPYSLAGNAFESFESIREARDEAQRGEIEVIITGKLEVTSGGSREILYDEFAFYDSIVTLSMIRVDTGEVLAKATERFAAPALAGDQALDRAFQGLMPRAAQAIASNLLTDWTNTVLDSGDYRLMVTGVTQEELEGVFNLLKTFSPESKVFVKSYFGEVAVINFHVPTAKPGEVEGFLRKSNFPQFKVRSAGERRIELRLL